jgi:hypothetical protein
MTGSEPMSETAFLESGLRSWRIAMDRSGKFFTSRSAEELEKTIAPDRNRLIYLWGHLTAVNDRMIPLLGLGARFYPELDPVFIVTPDRSVANTFTAKDLAEKWNHLDQFLWQKFNALSPAEWLARHEEVSEEAFQAEPHRNRFNVLLNRTNHISFHVGQAILTR